MAHQMRAPRRMTIVQAIGDTLDVVLFGFPINLVYPGRFRELLSGGTRYCPAQLSRVARCDGSGCSAIGGEGCCEPLSPASAVIAAGPVETPGAVATLGASVLPLALRKDTQPSGRVAR